MPLPLAAIPLAISAIEALLKYRRRIDEILSTKETTVELPYLLPEAPSNDEPHWNAIIQFFEPKDSIGQALLLVNNLQTVFEQFANARREGKNPAYEARKKLYRLYCEACGVPIEKKVPSGQSLYSYLDAGANPDMILAYYVVSSQRLSQNPAVTRIILATADTLLEVAGQNAGLFVSNKKTRAIVETLVDEFAVKRDFNDEKSELILKTLLGSAIIAVAENPGKLAEKPALKPLFSAIGDVRKKLGDDFVAKIISHEGFNALASGYLTHVSKDTSFVTKDEFFKSVLSQTLLELANKFETIQKDPKAILGVLEVALTASAANVDGILNRKFGDKPLLVAVLSAVADQIEQLGKDNQLISSIGSGTLFPAVYSTALKVIEANPSLINDVIKTKDYVGSLLAGLAGVLADYKGIQPGDELLKNIVVKSLDILSTQPDFLGKNQNFANAIIAAVFKTGAQVGSDGFSIDDLLAVIQEAIKVATGNIGLVKMDDKYAALIESFGIALGQHDIRKLLTPEGLKDTMYAILKTIAANPTIWNGLHEKNLVQPIVQAVLSGLSKDSTNLLSGPRLVSAIHQIFVVLARQGSKFINGNIAPADINEFLKNALTRVQGEIGNSIDGENVVNFLIQVLKAYIQSPFPVNKIQDVENLLSDVLKKGF